MKRTGTLKLSKRTISAMKAQPENPLYKDVLEMDGKEVKFDLVEKTHEFSTAMANFYTYRGGEATSLSLDCFIDVEKTPNMSHDGIQKQHCGHRAQIFTNTYGRMPSKIHDFMKLAREDFQTLKDDDFEIVIFDGERKKGVMGIRFSIPEDQKFPKDYFEWSDYHHMDPVA